MKSQATDEVMTFHQAMRSISDKGKLVASWYELEECLRPIGKFILDVVPVIPSRTARGGLFFPAPRRGADKSRRKRAKKDATGTGEEATEVAATESQSDAEVADAIEDARPEFDENREENGGDLALWLDGVAPELEAPMEQFVAPDQPVEAPHAPDAAEGVAAPLVAQPPPPPPPLVPLARGSRSRGEATVNFPMGRITFYESKGVFEAVCRNPLHGKCVLTRTSRCRAGTEGSETPLGGRPLGFLAAWLLKAEVGSKAEHWEPERMHNTLEERQAGRQVIRDAENGEALFAKERARGATEPEEPVYLDGLV